MRRGDCLALVLLAGCAKPPEPGTSLVVVARHDIPRGTIPANSVEVREVPEEWVQPGALTDPKDAIGKGTVALIRAGEQILDTKIASSGTAGLAGAIPKGYRALPVTVDPGTAALLRPGASVDVIWVGSGMAPLTGITILQNVFVLSVGGVSHTGQVSETAPATVVTLRLTPDESQKVSLAEAAGHLRFAIRSTDEGATQVPLDRMTLQSAIGLRPDGTWMEPQPLRRPRPTDEGHSRTPNSY